MKISFRQYRQCRAKLARVEKAALNLIEAVKAQDPQCVSNDLGNALDKLEDAMKS